MSFKTKTLAALGILLAARVILNLPFLTIYIMPTFKLISFTYITDAVVAMLFGFGWGACFAVAGDTLGYLVNPAGGAYFPGFALSEAVTCVIFAIFFYKKEIRLPRVIAAWLINLAVVLRGLNSLWFVLYYGQTTGEVFTLARVANNLIQSPIHIALLFFLLPKTKKLYERLD